MESLALTLAKRLYRHFVVVYGHKFTNGHVLDEIVNAWFDIWAELLADYKPEEIKIALDHCKKYLDWPPSLAEFRALCDKACGIPDPKTIIQDAIRRDFSHPLTQRIYDEIGSWSFSRDSEEVLLKKVKEAYQPMLDAYRADAAKSIEHGAKQIESTTHGSEVNRDNIRGNSVRKVESLVLPTLRMAEVCDTGGKEVH